MDQSQSAYPAQLANILGKGYNILNCGRGGATMLKASDLPYWKCNEFSNVFAFNPDIIVIALGTNDSKDYNWNVANYRSDYQAMIDTFNTIPSKPKIYLCLPPPSSNAFRINGATIVSEVIPAIADIAKSNSLPIIDFNHGLQKHIDKFPDGVHPDERGAAIMAGIVATELRK